MLTRTSATRTTGREQVGSLDVTVGRGAQHELQCAEHSRVMGEELAGTAPARVCRWLLVETAGRWSAKIQDTPALNRWSELLSAFELDENGLRVQLVAGGRAGAHQSPRWWCWNNGAEAEPRVETGTLPDLPCGEGLRDPGASDAPQYLVCVHGSRDACCGQRGSPLLRRMRERLGARVAPTSHLGGHRFAPTMLHLPSGLCLGRVDPERADAVIEALERGSVPPLDLVRGRCSRAAAAQAAECFLWSQQDPGNRAWRTFGAAELHGLGAEGRGTVTLRERGGAGRVIRVPVVRETSEARRIVSCGEGPGAPLVRWRCTRPS